MIRKLTERLSSLSNVMQMRSGKTELNLCRVDPTIFLDNYAILTHLTTTSNWKQARKCSLKRLVWVVSKGRYDFMILTGAGGRVKESSILS